MQEVKTIARLSPKDNHHIEKKLSELTKTKAVKKSSKVNKSHSNFFKDVLCEIQANTDTQYRLSGTFALSQDEQERKSISAVMPML